MNKLMDWNGMRTALPAASYTVRNALPAYSYAEPRYPFSSSLPPIFCAMGVLPTPSTMLPTTGTYPVTFLVAELMRRKVC